MNTIIELLINPAIISLMLGFAIGMYTFFRIPTFMSDAISLYLIFCIGLKGGMCLGVTNACTPPLIMLALLGLIVGFIQPFIYFFVLKRCTSVDQSTAMVVASQYGSISIVTFVTAVTFLEQHSIMYDTFMSAVAGMMEIPAIFGGLLLFEGTRVNGKGLIASFAQTGYQIISSPKISMLFVGFFIGFLLRSYQSVSIVPALLKPFTMILILFMIDIGIKIAQQRSYIHQFTWSLIAFGIYIPIIGGLLGIAISYLVGIQIGSALLFAILLASASYIAVPAIMRSQIPEAKEVIYLPLALAITLPFNVIIGIPLFYWIATSLL